MKKNIAICIILAILILLTGCGSEEAEDVTVLISVQRTGNILTNIGDLEIYVDDEMIFTVDGNSTNSSKLVLSEGEHTIQAKGQGDKSKKLKFEVSRDGATKFYYTAEIGSFLGVKLEERKDIPDELKEAYTFSNWSPFSDGVAWIEFSDVAESYIGCIDKKGNLLFQADASQIDDMTFFENGYSYLSTDDTFFVINKDGDILSKHSLIPTENYELCFNLCHDGYVVSKEYESGFDVSQYKYTIYNPAGEILTTHIVNENDEINYNYLAYCGEGVFQFKSDVFESYIVAPSRYYIASNDTWIDFDGSQFTKMYNGIGAVQMYSEEEMVYDEFGAETYSYTDHIILLNNKGEYEDINLGMELPSVLYAEIRVASEKIIFPSTINGAIVYDMRTGENVQLAEQYAENINRAEYEDIFSTSNDKILMPLYGEDGNTYIAVFDLDLNMLGEPIKYQAWQRTRDGSLKVESDVDTTIVYNTNLDIVTIPSNVSMVDDYSNNVVRVLENNTEEAYYLDDAGEILFQDINMDNARMVEFN